MSALSDYIADNLPDNTPYIENGGSDDDNAWKYISVGDIKGLADYTNREYNYRDIPFVGQLVGHASDAATQGVADLAQFVGADGVSDYLNQAAQEGEARLPTMTTPEFSLDYLTDPNGLTSAIGTVLGSALPGAALTGLLPLSGVAATAGKIASKAPVLGNVLGGVVKSGVRWAPSGIFEVMQEGGNTERDIMQNGGTRDEADAAARQVFLDNAGLLSGTQFLEGGLLGNLDKFSRPFKKGDTIANMALSAASKVPAVAADAALEGFEEGEQQGFQNAAEGKPYSMNPLDWTPDQIANAKLGVAGGLGMPAAFTLAGKASDVFSNTFGGSLNDDNGNTDTGETQAYEPHDVDLPPEVEDILNSNSQELAEKSSNSGGYSSSGNGDIDSYIENAAQQTGVPANIISAMIKNESGYNPNAKSDAGAIGLTQLMLGTAEELGVDPNDPAQNVLGGAIYIKQMYEKTGNWHDAFVAYNEGGGAWDEGKRYSESESYADKVMTDAGDAGAPSAGNGGGSTYDLPTQGDDITAQVQNLNPEFQSALPYIGGMLKDMGLADGAVISSAARTPEHNAEVNGAPNSYHVRGDAVDIVLPDSTTEEQEQEVLQRFKDSGAFTEVLFHDAGSGYHLHLGGYKGGLGSGNGGGSNTTSSIKLHDEGDKDLFDLNDSNNLDADLGKEQIADFAKYMKDTSSDPDEVNIFEGMFSTDRKGNDKFDDSDKNIQKIKDNYAAELADYARAMKQADEVGNQQDTTTSTQTVSKNPLAAKVKTAESAPIKTYDAKFIKQVQAAQTVKKATEEIKSTPGEILIDLAKANQIPMNEKLQTDLKANVPLAVKTMQNRLHDRALKGGIKVNENSESENIQTAQRKSTEDKIPDAVSEQSKEQTQVNSPAPQIKTIDDESSAVRGYIKSLQQQKSAKIADMLNYYKNNPGGRGVEQGGLIRNSEGEVVNRFGRVSKNPTWYQQAFKEYGHRPNKSELREFAVTQLQDDPEFVGLDRDIKEATEYLANKNNQSAKAIPTTKDYTERADNIIRKHKQKEMDKTATASRLKRVENDAQKDYKAGKISETDRDKIKSYVDSNTKAIYKKQSETASEKRVATNDVNGTKEKVAQAKKDTSRFGSEEDAKDDLLKAFGKKAEVVEKASRQNKVESIKKVPKKIMNVIDDSDDALTAAIKDFDSEINNLSSNPVFNPKLMIAGFKIGMIHLQRGINNFADWSAKMLDSSNKLKPFLKSIWQSINSYPKNMKFNEEQMSAVMRYIGTQYDKGITDKEELRQLLENTIGKEYSKLIDSAYEGVKNFPTKEAIRDANDSNNSMAARDSQRSNKDAVGSDDEGKESSRSNGQDRRTAGQRENTNRGENGILPSSTATGGKTGHSTVRRKESTDKSGSTRDTKLSRSVTDSYEGQSLSDKRQSKRALTPLAVGRNNAGNIIRPQTKIGIKQAGNLAAIKKDLPFLLPEQQNDVAFAEKRLLKNNGKGVLFTNGTGTGKTFTGLGIIKRFANAGKMNTLIVAPTNEIITAWIKAARKFFGLGVTPLKNIKDAGHGISITTYANLGDNNSLAKRKWDLIVADESHSLMQSEKGERTAALDKLRALTMHPEGFHDRFKMLHQPEYAKLKKATDAGDSKREQALTQAINDSERKTSEAWKKIADKAKPKVTFLSATPFAYVPDIDYANGYLFEYTNKIAGNYNESDGKAQFFMNNFGYRMRYNRLTKPEADVDSSIMERSFHEKLRKNGALSGRMLTIDKDYDRGFILVDGGIGKKIDEGFDYLYSHDSGKYKELADILGKQYSYQNKMYLLEAIKAKESIGLINQYLSTGKKVVVFHDYNKGGATNPFILDKNELRRLAKKDDSNVNMSKILDLYDEFGKERPDLVGLKLKDVPSPIDALTKVYGNKLLLFNGTISKAERAKSVEAFNDDNSGKNVILVQSDAGQAGISLHDTTGKHQRVLINLGLPTKPVAAIQTEGRIYRVGNKTNAIFRYLNTGTSIERDAFASKIAERASTAENLALGDEARTLKESFIKSFEETDDSDEWKRYLPGNKKEGIGGREADRAAQTNLSDFDKAIAYYYTQQKKTSGNKSAEGVDYFATPEPLGQKIVEWAKLKPNDSALEPSAGHGAISRWLPENTRNVIIEPSNSLYTKAKLNLANGKAINSDFEDYHINNKFNAIMMNPPFGHGGKTAIMHLTKAFKHLKDGGRIVAILPDGTSMQKQFDTWLKGTDNAIVMKKISLPDVTFKRAGTAVNTKLIIIDRQDTKEGQKASQAVAQGESSIEADNANELFAKLRDIDAPERISSQKEKALTDTDKDVKLSVDKNNDGAPTDAHIQKMLDKKKDIVREDLTDREKAIVDFADKMGAKVQFFVGNPRLHGYYQDGTTFLNRKSNTKPSWTFWHEAFHWLKSNNEALYADIVKHVSATEQFSQKQLDDYRQNIGRENLSDADTIEEMLADAMPEVKNRVSFMKDLGKENPSLAQRFVSWIRDIMKKFTDFMHNPKAGLTTKQRDSMIGAFDKLARDMVDDKGRRVFGSDSKSSQQRLEHDSAVWQNLCDLYTRSDKKTWHDKNNGMLFKFMNMPLVLDMIGAKNMKLNVYGSFFEHVVNPKHPGMNMDVVKQLPKAMANPLMIFKTDRKNKYVFVLGIKDNKGATVIVPVELEKHDLYHGVINVLNSAYGRLTSSNKKPNMKWFANRINQGDLIYVNKKESTSWFSPSGENTPVGTALRNALGKANAFSNSSIKTEDDLVKEKEEHPTRYSVDKEDTLSAKKRLEYDSEKWSNLCNLYDKTDPKIWHDSQNGTLFKFMDMPLVLNLIGAKGMKLRVYGSFFKHVLRPMHPGMTLDLVKQLPKAMTDPLMIFKTDNPNKFIFTLELQTNNGANIIVPIELEKKDDNYGLINVANTAFGRLKANGKPNYNWFVRKINDGDLVYVNKEKSAIRFKPSGDTTPVGLALINALKKPDGFSDSTAKMRPSGVQAPAGYSSPSDIVNSSIKTEDDLVKEKEEHPTRYSVDEREIEEQDKSFVAKMNAKFAGKFAKDNPNIKLAEPHADKTIGVIGRRLASPSRIAKKVPHFKQFFSYADTAMNALTRSRSGFNRKLNKALELVKAKDDKKSLYTILWNGDAEGKDYSKDKLLQSGVKENVADAYMRVRQLMTKAYIMLNDARRHVQTKSEHVTPGKLADLKDNKFVKIIKEDKDSGLVTYKEYTNWKKEYIVNKDELQRLKHDNAVQVLKPEQTGLAADGSPLYKVTVRESVPDIHKLSGYIPHFFHNYMVRVRAADEDGNIIYRVVGSGRTVKEAYEVAEKYLKENKMDEDSKITISPKTFDFNALGVDEAKFAVVMGDNNYQQMMKTLSKNNDMTLAEAREFVNGSVKQKNRHRFFGNFMQRKGANGFETNLDWVLRHYFNSAARYAALETHFKPKAISLFERLYGAFDKEYSGTAKYTKEYINDINGVPSDTEKEINRILNSWQWFRKHVTANFGDRAALQVANNLTKKTTILKLGGLNISSAMINFTQLANAMAYIGKPKVLWQAIAKGAHRKYSRHDLRVLVETNVMNDIGLDSGSGYDMWRSMKGINLKSAHSIGNVLSNANSAIDYLGNKSLFLFKQSEGLIRRGTVLAAYDNGIKRGMSHEEAIEYAKDIDHKANFDYSVADAPNIFRRGSVISQLLLQFKKYPIKELEAMSDFMPLLSKNTSAKQKALFWGSYFLLAGLLQIPFFDLFDDMSKLFLGTSPKDKAMTYIMKYCSDHPALKSLGQIAMYGLLAPADIDISYRAGIADVLPSKMSDLAGPTFGTIANTICNLLKGNTVSALRSLSPGLANIYMGMTGESIGARNRTQTVYSSNYERLLRIMGFRSVDEANAFNIQSIIYNQKQKMADDKKDAIDNYLDKPSTKGAQLLRELGVKPETVKKERARKQMTTKERTQRSMTKEDSKENSYLFDFAK